MSSRILFVSFIILLLRSFGDVEAQQSSYHRRALAKVVDPKLGEISGIVPSTTLLNHFWVHNDSGDGASIYLIDTLGKLRYEVVLEDVKAVDFEDIAWLNVDGIPHLLVADIGNNRKDREVLSLYLFEEPTLTGDCKKPSKIVISRSDIKEIKIRYVDKKRDAEAIFVDPIDNQVWIISKRDLHVHLFSFTISDQETGIVNLYPKATLPFTFITAADISDDGSQIVMKSLVQIYHWDRQQESSILKTLSKPFRTIPYTVEPQGEAIAFDKNNADFYSISERALGMDAYLYKYEKTVK